MTVTIIINVSNHRHKGEIVAKGTEIEVTDIVAEMLVNRGKAHYKEVLQNG